MGRIQRPQPPRRRRSRHPLIPCTPHNPFLLTRPGRPRRKHSRAPAVSSSASAPAVITRAAANVPSAKKRNCSRGVPPQASHPPPCLPSSTKSCALPASRWTVPRALSWSRASDTTSARCACIPTHALRSRQARSEHSHLRSDVILYLTPIDLLRLPMRVVRSSLTN